MRTPLFRRLPSAASDHHEKSKRPKTWPILALMMASVMLLVACGGDASDSGDASSDLDGASAEESVAATVVQAAGAEPAQSPDVRANNNANVVAADSAAQVDSGAADAAEGDEAAEPEEAAEPPADGDASGGAIATGLTAADLSRDIVFTARIEVDVEDVVAAGEEAVAAVAGVGGFVFGQQTLGGSEPSSEFVFKVLPEDFDDALDVLGGIGELRNQSVSADDVTERVVDIQSRISVAELGVQRLRTALEATTNLEDFATFEDRLIERETELELLRGQLRTLQDQVELATITLVLTQDRVVNNIELNVSLYEELDLGLSCPGQQSLSVEAGLPMTVCFELINTGDQTLENLTLIDTGLGIDENTQLLSVFGKLSEPLLPGQSIILAHELTPERDLRLRARAGGQPTAMEGEEPAGPPVSTTRNLVVDVRPSQADPGFSDGFEAGSGVLVAIWTVTKVVAGFVVPLLILLPFLIAAGWALRKFRSRPGRRVKKTRTAYIPPPANPVPQPATVGSPPPPASSSQPVAGPTGDGSPPASATDLPEPPAPPPAAEG